MLMLYLILTVIVICTINVDSRFINTETEYCTESEYRCDNGICIQKKGICDGTQKCLDGSDKKYTMCEKRHSKESTRKESIEPNVGSTSDINYRTRKNLPYVVSSDSNEYPDSVPTTVVSKRKQSNNYYQSTQFIQTGVGSDESSGDQPTEGSEIEINDTTRQSMPYEVSSDETGSFQTNIVSKIEQSNNYYQSTQFIQTGVSSDESSGDQPTEASEIEINDTTRQSMPYEVSSDETGSFQTNIVSKIEQSNNYYQSTQFIQTGVGSDESSGDQPTEASELEINDTTGQSIPYEVSSDTSEYPRSALLIMGINLENSYLSGQNQNRNGNDSKTSQIADSLPPDENNSSEEDNSSDGDSSSDGEMRGE